FLESQPDFFRPFAPKVAATGCEERDAVRLKAMFEPRLARWPALRRSLDQAMEGIRVCAAEREAESGAVAAFFTPTEPARPGGTARARGGDR
ncbi:MAG TPA: hypothetical protein VFK85_09125, partial [Anaeromyxobacteraceae bacterium]|nr:hypothetical protein [Anaeromyxobacteraceae bacterium]